MIKITIKRNVAQACIGFCVAGHAATAVLGLERHLNREILLAQADGRFCIDLVGLPDQETAAVLETMLLGLKEIAKSNPRSVRISEHRR
jgi:uncharacterized protein YsxB (DUF464 family)